LIFRDAVFTLFLPYTDRALQKKSAARIKQAGQPCVKGVCPMKANIGEHSSGFFR